MSNNVVKSKVSISFKSESGYEGSSAYNTQNSDALLDAAESIARILSVEGRFDELTERLEGLNR